MVEDMVYYVGDILEGCILGCGKDTYEIRKLKRSDVEEFQGIGKMMIEERKKLNAISTVPDPEEIAEFLKVIGPLNEQYNNLLEKGELVGRLTTTAEKYTLGDIIGRGKTASGPAKTLVKI